MTNHESPVGSELVPSARGTMDIFRGVYSLYASPCEQDLSEKQIAQITPAVINAFALPDRIRYNPNYFSLSSLLSFTGVKAVILNDALQGQSQQRHPEEMASEIESLFIWNEIFALVASYAPDGADENTPLRSMLQNPNDTYAGPSSKKIARDLKEAYVTESGWLGENLAMTFQDASMAVASIYARAARSDGRVLPRTIKNHLRSVLTELKATYPHLHERRGELQIPVDDIVSARVSEKQPNQLKEAVDRLGNQALPIANYIIIREALVILDGALEQLLKYPGSKRLDMEHAATLIAATTLPENLWNLSSPEDGTEVDIIEPQITELDFAPMQLDWEVLPPGEVIRFCTDIISKPRQTGAIQPKIDFERLKALETIRENWGADNCYYARGKLGQRRIVHEGDTSQPDEYIILVLQERDNDGNILYEHAIAESPIVGPHAMYIYRQDTNRSTNWRTVMSVSKQDARRMGARQIKHSNDDGGQALALSEKASLLLCCAPEEFKQLQFNGIRGFRLTMVQSKEDSSATG